MNVGSILSRWWEGGLLCAPNLLLNTLFPWEHQTSPDGVHHGNTTWPPPDMTCLAAPIPELGSLMTSIPQVQTVTRIHGDLRLTFAADGRDRIGIAVPVVGFSRDAHPPSMACNGFYGNRA